MKNHCLRWVCAGLILTWANSALAEPHLLGDTIDQSLFHSEPVEEAPMAEPPPLPARATIAKEKPVPSPAEEAPVIYDTAVIQGLKKVVAETSLFEAPVDTPVVFGTLTILVKKCVKSKPEEEPDNAALILIKDNRPDEPPKVVFSGWMFSSSPAISALEHPVYDITMRDCIVKKKPAPEKTQAR